jgi:hypothetical protein
VTKVSLRGLAGRKLRAALTGIAIVLGVVATISGTCILVVTFDTFSITVAQRTREIWILAAIMPARRAARLNPLEAIAYE